MDSFSQTCGGHWKAVKIIYGIRRKYYGKMEKSLRWYSA